MTESEVPLPEKPGIHVVPAVSDEEPDESPGLTWSGMDEKQMGVRLDRIRADFNLAVAGVDAGDSLLALEALTLLVKSAGEARVYLTRNTHMEQFYIQKAQANS